MSQNQDAHLDQSVAEAVGLDMSKLQTPCSTCFTISSFDFWKASSKSGDQANGALVESRCRNGSMSVAEAKAKLICPTHPNHELMSVILRVVGRSRIDWMNSGGCWMWENFRGPGSHAGYICVEYTRIGQNQVRFNIFI